MIGVFSHSNVGSIMFFGRAEVWIIFLEDDWSTTIFACFADSSKDHVHRGRHCEIALQGFRLK